MSQPILQEGLTDVIGDLITRIEALESGLTASGISPGMILWYPGLDIPYSFAKCEGGTLLRADYPEAFDNITILTLGDLSSGSPTISNLFPEVWALVNNAGGWDVENANIPNDTQITGKSGTSLTMDANASGTEVGATIRLLPWGQGDGSTTFNLPDLRDKTLVGINSAAAEFQYIAQTTGAKTHTLIDGELPIHSHSSSLATASGLNDITVNSVGTFTGGGGATGVVSVSESHGTLAVTGTIGGGGSDDPHNNIQPSAAGYFIIKLDVI